MINQSVVTSALSQGLQAMGLSLTEQQQQLLVAYLGLLKKWNQAYNLTAITDDIPMVTHHLLDSLSIVDYIEGGSVLDVGTGGGVPGIPLAIFYPEKTFCLIDSNGKKVRFLRHVAQQLRLARVSVVQSRAEQFASSSTFDTIVARAVGSLDALLQWTRSLVSLQGHWVLMKGHRPEEELQSVALPWRVVKLDVPGIDAKRHAVLIKNTG